MRRTLLLTTGLLVATPVFAQDEPARARPEGLNEAFESLLEGVPAANGPERVDITGMESGVAEMMLEDELQAALSDRDMEAFLALVLANDLELDMEASSASTLALRSAVVKSAAELFTQAAFTGDVAAMRAMLASDDIDIDVPSAEGVAPPLLVAAMRGRYDAVRFLLERGADPGVESYDMDALGFALTEGHLDVAELLLDAGGDVPDDVGLLLRFSPLRVAIENGDDALFDFLMERGVDPDRADEYGWTPSMSALLARNLPMARRLLAVGDPRIRSTRDLTEYGTDLPMRHTVLPRGDARFIATLLPAPGGAELVDAVEARVREIGSDDDLRAMRLATGMSAAELAVHEGEPARGADRLEAAIAEAKPSSLTGTSLDTLVRRSLYALVMLHELRLVSGGELAPARRDEAAHLEALGGEMSKWHDMLDAFATPVTDAVALERWRDAHGFLERGDYDFRWIESWIDAMPDGEPRTRLEETLAFFERRD